MIYHTKCSNPVLLDISKHIVCAVTFGMLRNGLKVSNGDIFIKEGKFSSDFFCPRCKENVPMDQLFSFCMNCGEKFNLDELYKPSHSNGVYCKPCSQSFELAGENIYLFSVIAKTTIYK